MAFGVIVVLVINYYIYSIRSELITDLSVNQCESCEVRYMLKYFILKNKYNVHRLTEGTFAS